MGKTQTWMERIKFGTNGSGRHHCRFKSPAGSLPRSGRGYGGCGRGGGAAWSLLPRGRAPGGRGQGPPLRRRLARRSLLAAGTSGQSLPRTRPGGKAATGRRTLLRRTGAAPAGSRRPRRPEDLPDEKKRRRRRLIKDRFKAEVGNEGEHLCGPGRSGTGRRPAWGPSARSR